MGNLSSQSPRACNSCMGRKELSSRPSQGPSYNLGPDLLKSRNTKFQVTNLSQFAQSFPDFNTESLTFWEPPESPENPDFDTLIKAEIKKNSSPWPQPWKTTPHISPDPWKPAGSQTDNIRLHTVPHSSLYNET